VRNFNKGDELEAVILAIDPERERISLGIKQMDQDPFSMYVAENQKGSIVTGTVREVDARGAVIDLADQVEGYLRASELSRDRVEDASTVLKVGEEVEAKFIAVDRKNRRISLSIKAKDTDDEKVAVDDYNKSAPVTPTLGDLIKEQMNN
jgi:small subunit ribosomal protein S1